MDLHEIVESGLCSGCGACVYVAGESAVKMEMDKSGYLRPIELRPLINSEQEAIRKVCPGIGLEHPPTFDKPITYHPVWGPIIDLQAGYANDPEVRYKGSSGGVLSSLLIYLIETKQVDFVVQTKASQRFPLLNETVFSETREDIISAAGSRYAPASPVSAIGEALLKKGKFAFVGKPCDVAAVRKIIQSDPALEARIPFLLSFMCAGTPSMKGTEEIISQFKVNKQDVTRFDYRGNGWPGMTKVELEDETVKAMDYNTSWGSILNKHLQPRCKMCADGTGEFADIVGADAWYGKDGYPDFTEQDGRSLIIARSLKGKMVMDLAERSKVIQAAQFNLSKLSTIQPYQFLRKASMVPRLLSLRIFARKVPRYLNMELIAASSESSFRKHAREFLGTISRCIKGRV